MAAHTDKECAMDNRQHGRRLVYFSSVPYASYAQRPHFMVDAFVNGGFDSVLWIDPYPTRLPAIADLRRGRSRSTPAGRADDARIKVLRPRALPIEPLPGSGIVNHVVAWRTLCAQMLEFANETQHCVLAIGRPSKLAQWALTHIPHARSFADILDDFPAFYRGLSKISMRARLRAVCQCVTDVYCSSSKLAEDLRKLRHDVLIVLNGYSTQQLSEPSNVQARRYVGYVGTIAEWFDWPLVCSLALALPDVTIRLVGPEFVSRPASLPANIEFLGELPNSRIANIVNEFAVGLIPFRITELTAGVDPIKFYEYRSMGVPVWSTSFGEMQSRGHEDGVTHISQKSNWRILWEQARAIPASQEEITSFRAQVDWGRRLDPVITRSRIAATGPSHTDLNVTFSGA
jgi:hypothetical protein